MNIFRDGFKGAETIAHLVEKVIVAIIRGINQTKEKVMISWVQRNWPSWLTPNKLTGIRIGLALLLLIVILFEDYQANSKVIVIFLAAALTDLFDGVVARAWRKESALGALLDKIADRALIIPLGWVEFWPKDKLLVVVSLIGMAAILIIVLVNYFRKETRQISGSIFGWAAMWCYSLAVLLAIWPSLWNIADKIGWIGVGFGTTAFLVGFKKLLDILGHSKK